MKVSLYEAGGRLEGGFTMAGMTLTGPLLLSGTVSSPLEAIHKQYIDTAVTNLDAANFVSGTIATARLPALTGDVTSSNSSNNVVLNVSGVIAGDYTKVTVDAKGRVTVGLSLTEADLPSFNWSKFTLNKPNTLNGYGITDGVSLVNGVLTGPLILKGDPTAANHAATKAYADANSSTGAKIVTGDVVSNITNDTPSGFLRCNGGELSKTTYSALYAVIGDVASVSIQPGNGQPWRQQYQINEVQNGDISGWAITTALPATLYSTQAIVTKNRVYLIGGSNGSVNGIMAYTAPINSDGTLGAWTTTTNLPIPLYQSQVVITKNRVYLLGGISGSNSVATVYTAPINADGTLGTWVTGTDLPAALYGSQAVVTKNRVYLLGGGTYSGGITANTYSAPINSDGTLGAWVAGTALPAALTYSQAIVTKNRVYLLGGYNGNTVATVYTAPINSDGTIGTWTTGTSLPSAVMYAQAFVTKNSVYLIGGENGNPNYMMSVFVAPINADGTLGTWAAGSTLPITISRTQVFAAKNKVYIAGGTNGSALNRVCVATISGGLNDYSAYYDGTITVTDPNNFKLPDYTSYEKTSLYFYIKS